MIHTPARARAAGVARRLAAASVAAVGRHQPAHWVVAVLRRRRRCHRTPPLGAAVTARMHSLSSAALRRWARASVFEAKLSPRLPGKPAGRARRAARLSLRSHGVSPTTSPRGGGGAASLVGTYTASGALQLR